MTGLVVLVLFKGIMPRNRVGASVSRGGDKVLYSKSR